MISALFLPLACAQRWNDTYVHFHKTDPKQTYYLSMEYLQGRALSNAVGSLGITGAYAEALKKFGYELEAIAGQVRLSSIEVLLVLNLAGICLVTSTPLFN